MYFQNVHINNKYTCLIIQHILDENLIQMRDVGWMMCQLHSKSFIIRPVSAIRPSSVTDNLSGRYYVISGYEMLQQLGIVN